MKRISNRVLEASVKILTVSIATILLVLNLFYGGLNSIVAVFVIGISLALLYRVRHDLYLFTIFGCILYCNYSICMANYISHVSSFFTTYSNTETGAEGLNLLFFFTIMLFFAMPRVSKSVKRRITFNSRRNSTIVLGLVILLVVIWYLGYKRPETSGARGQSSSLYEYSVILIIMAYYYSAEDRILHWIITIVAFAFALQNFVFGGRITGVQIILAVILCLFVDRIDFKTMIILGVGFLISMSAVGIFRGNILSAENILKSVITSLRRTKYAMDTAYSAYFTSLTFLKTMEFTPIEKRLSLFLRWILSIFLGGRVTDSNLSIYTRQYFQHYYGGVLPFYAFFYLGIVGIVLISYYLRLWLKTINKVDANSSGLLRCIAVYISSTTLRWYLYSPSQLFRGVLILCAVYGMLYCIDCMLYKSPIILSIKQR